MKRLLVAVIFYLVISSSSFAQTIGYNEEFQLVNYEHIHNFSFIPFDENKFVGCWDGFWLDESTDGVKGQIFSVDGNKIGNEFPVNTYTDSWQNNPKIAKINNNKFVVCWVSENQDGDQSGIFAQIFDEKGNKIGSEFQVNSYTDRWQDEPEIASITENKFVVTWISKYQDGGDDGIYAQIFDSNGTKIGNEFRINTYTIGSQNNQSIATINDNRFVVSWVRRENEDEDYGIVAKIFDEEGNVDVNQFYVNTFKFGKQSEPTITAINEEKFVICWNSEGQDGDGFGVFAQIFDISGTKIGVELQVNTNTKQDQKFPKIISLNKNKFAVFWNTRIGSGYNYELTMQIFDNNGSKIGYEQKVVNLGHIYSVNQSSIANINEDKFIVYWPNEEHEEWGAGIFAKMYLKNPILHVLNNFEILEPIYDGTLETAQPIFKWACPSNQHFNFQWEVEYNLYISDDEEFTNPRIVSGITDTTYQIDTLASGKTYFWKVLAKNIDGDSLWSSNVNGFYIDENATDVEENNLLPSEFIVDQNYPNPFNPSTKIKYSIPVGQSNYHVVIKVYDVLGRIVKELVNTNQQAGNYKVEFNATNLNSGIYFYKVTAGKFSITKKMVLMK